MDSSNGHAPQQDDERIDFETASFDGDDLAELDMEEFGNVDITNTFLDTEAPGVVAVTFRSAKNEVSSSSGQIKDGVEPSSSSACSPAKNKAKSKSDGGAIKGPSRRKKRPKGKPRRPLCGYNIFFQRHSKEIQATTPFKDLGRVMGERWKALTEEQRSVYEKEAEKDVVRFHREMDIYERKRREQLCPSNTSEKPKLASSAIDLKSPLTASSTLKPPPGWSATSVNPYLNGFTPLANSANFPPENKGPPPLPNTGVHIPQQTMGPPPTAMALPQGTEISLPDQTGSLRKYRVVYACYSMTHQEANDYMARFAALTAGCHQSFAPLGAAPPAASPPPPSPQPFVQPVPHPSPQVSRPVASSPLPLPLPIPQAPHTPLHQNPLNSQGIPRQGVAPRSPWRT